MTIENQNTKDTVLMLHLDGPTGTKVVEDSAVGSVIPNVFTVGGVLDATTKWQGISSLDCHGVDNNLIVHASSNFRFGASSWHIDARFYVRTASAPHLFSWWRDDDNYLSFVHTRTIGTTAKYLLRLRVNGVTIAESTSEKSIPLIGAFHHVVVMRDAGTITSWHDGFLLGPSLALPSTTFELNLHQWDLNIGRAVRFGRSGLGHLDGWVDEIKVHRGPLLTPPGVRASVSYVEPQQQYEQPVVKTVLGFQNTLRLVAKTVKGVQNVGLLPAVKTVSGNQQIRTDAVKTISGRHTVRVEVIKTIRGIHSIGFTSTKAATTYIKTVRGQHSVRRLVVKTARGSQNIGLQLAVKTIRGQQHVRRLARKTVSGTHSVRRQIVKLIIGTQQIDKTVTQYAIFYNFGSPPDLTATPWDTTSTLPYETAVAITGEGLHYFVVREFSPAGVSSENIESLIIELDGSDNEILRLATAPRDVVLTAEKSGAFRITARYEVRLDVGGRAAETWVLYIRTDGSVPDPDSDVPIVVNVGTTGGIARLDHKSATGPGGQTVKAIVGVSQSAGRKSLASVVTVVTSVTGPSQPVIDVIHTRDRKPTALQRV